MECMRRKLTWAQVAALSIIFKAEEIRVALFCMHPNRAPGSDGLTTFFYQKFWGTRNGGGI